MIENSLVQVWIKSYMGDELMKKVKNNEKKPTAYTPSPQKSLIKTQYDHLDQSSTVEQIEAH